MATAHSDSIAAATTTRPTVFLRSYITRPPVRILLSVLRRSPRIQLAVLIQPVGRARFLTIRQRSIIRPMAQTPSFITRPAALTRRLDSMRFLATLRRHLVLLSVRKRF